VSGRHILRSLKRSPHGSRTLPGPPISGDSHE
jgi:hypothetical protein